jgi:hypothetical protein
MELEGCQIPVEWLMKPRRSALESDNRPLQQWAERTEKAADLRTLKEMKKRLVEIRLWEQESKKAGALKEIERLEILVEAARIRLQDADPCELNRLLIDDHYMALLSIDIINLSMHYFNRM